MIRARVFKKQTRWWVRFTESCGITTDVPHLSFESALHHARSFIPRQQSDTPQSGGPTQKGQ